MAKQSRSVVGDRGVQNELFFRDNTLMLFGDAKKMTDSIVKAMQH